MLCWGGAHLGPPVAPGAGDGVHVVGVGGALGHASLWSQMEGRVRELRWRRSVPRRRVLEGEVWVRHREGNRKFVANTIAIGHMHAISEIKWSYADDEDV